MMTEHLAGRVTLLAASALVATLMSGCTGAPQSAGAGSTTTTPNGNSSLPTQITGSTGQAATATGSAGQAAAGTGSAVRVTTPRCNAADLKANLGVAGGAAMGHVFRSVQFTNIASAPCVIQGFPGVSFVTGDNGQQVGAPADRDGEIGPPVTLAPGQTANASLQMLNGTGAYPPNEPACAATPVRGIRVFPPDDTGALFIPLDSTACGNPSNHTMSVRTVQAGDGATR